MGTGTMYPTPRGFGGGFVPTESFDAPNPTFIAPPPLRSQNKKNLHNPNISETNTNNNETSSSSSGHDRCSESERAGTQPNSSTPTPNLCGIPLKSPRMGLESPRGKALEELSELQSLMAQDVSSMKSRMRQNAEKRNKERTEQEHIRELEKQSRLRESQEKEDQRRNHDLKSIEEGLRATLTSRETDNIENDDIFPDLLDDEDALEYEDAEFDA